HCRPNTDSSRIVVPSSEPPQGAGAGPEAHRLHPVVVGLGLQYLGLGLQSVGFLGPVLPEGEQVVEVRGGHSIRRSTCTGILGISSGSSSTPSSVQQMRSSPCSMVAIFSPLGSTAMVRPSGNRSTVHIIPHIIPPPGSRCHHRPAAGKPTSRRSGSGRGCTR